MLTHFGSLKAVKQATAEELAACPGISKSLAQQIVAATAGQSATIDKAKRRRTTEKQPLLYDLTALQRRANQRYGLSAQRTLEVAQALYEKHKLLSYPRTDSRHLSTSVAKDLPRVVDEIYRHVRSGSRVLAVVSAFGSTTNELLERARQLGVAAIDQKRGELEAALSYHKRALSISEARLGKDHPNVASSL